MIESGCISSDLPELDRKDDPQGGAVAWALLAVGAMLVALFCAATFWVVGIG